MLHNGNYPYAYFFWILHIIKMKFSQVLVNFVADFSNIFFVQCWRLKTSSRPFHDFNRMSIDLSIFSSWHLPFLIVPYSSFQNMMHRKVYMIGYWVIEAGWSTEKGLEHSPSPPNFSKDSWKLLPLLVSIIWPSLVA